MTPEEQRIAIAQACGWTLEEARRGFKTVEIKESGYIYNKVSDKLPDYLNDLNAMHEAEKVLSYEQFDDYYIELAKRMVRPFHATAAQRAEAFLKTLNLCKP